MSQGPEDDQAPSPAKPATHDAPPPTSPVPELPVTEPSGSVTARPEALHGVFEAYCTATEASHRDRLRVALEDLGAVLVTAEEMADFEPTTMEVVQEITTVVPVRHGQVAWHETTGLRYRVSGELIRRAGVMRYRYRWAGPEAPTSNEISPATQVALPTTDHRVTSDGTSTWPRQVIE